MTSGPEGAERSGQPHSGLRPFREADRGLAPKATHGPPLRGGCRSASHCVRLQRLLVNLDPQSRPGRYSHVTLHDFERFGQEFAAQG